MPARHVLFVRRASHYNFFSGLVGRQQRPHHLQSGQESLLGRQQRGFLVQAIQRVLSRATDAVDQAKQQFHFHHEDLMLQQTTILYRDQ